MIKIKNLNFTYDSIEQPILKDLNLEISKSDHTAIIGPNGCGKTTLIRHINGLLLPSSGDVLVDGRNTKDPVSVMEIRSKVGMVFQNPDNQIVGMSVEEDVSFGPGNLGLSPGEIGKRVKDSLAQVNMTEAAQRAPHTLSNGEKQLVALAGVLAMEPEYIILDEPTSYLDPSSRKRIMEVISTLHRKGISIIHVTHDMDEAAKADNIVVMDNGYVLAQARPADIFNKMDWLMELGLTIPKAGQLMYKLREMGIEIRTDILTMDEACKELALLLKQKVI